MTIRYIESPTRVCTRYTCNRLGTIETELGGRCEEHAREPLMLRVQVQHDDSRNPRGREVPYGLVAPHARQAWMNHDQSLQRLEERGGICESEMLAVLEDRDWRQMDEREAGREVNRLVAEYKSRLLK